jgi:uncharacterized protein YciI
MVRLVLSALIALAPLCAAADEPMTKYFVAFLYKGPKFAAAAADSPERKLNHEQHVAYIEEMQAAGKLVTYGPVLDGGDLRGMYIFKAASLDEARAWAGREPSVKIGMIEMRVYAWLGPAPLAVGQCAVK